MVMSFNSLSLEFKLRFLSSLVLLLALIVIYLVGELAIKLILFGLSICLFYELENLYKKKKIHIDILCFGIFLYLINSLSFFQLNYNFKFNFIFLLINSILIFFFYYDKKNIHFFLISSLINLLIFSFFYLVEIYNIHFIFLIISLISVNDVMAYLVGRKIGKTKIFPNISPKKSLEGTLAGIIFTIIISLFYAYFLNLDYFSYILLGFLIAIVGLFGDLYISIFKRKLKIKDISNIIPGHGGFLDRFDSYLFCIPLSILMLKTFLV